MSQPDNCRRGIGTAGAFLPRETIGPSLPRSWQPSEVARDVLLAERQQAHSHGAGAAALGLPRDTNPHSEGTALWISWNAGWKEAAL